MTDHKRIEESFSRQGFMQTLGATLVAVETGKVTITAAFRDTLTQQHGYLHAGVMTAMVDTACGYAALSTTADGYEVLTVEFKINFLKPAKTNKIIAVGEVTQSGRTLTTCEGTVYNETKDKVLAKMMATMIIIKTNK
jgi:uncharacterized protein (TIGR00369 family)